MKISRYSLFLFALLSTSGAVHAKKSLDLALPPAPDEHPSSSSKDADKNTLPPAPVEEDEEEFDDTEVEEITSTEADPQQVISRNTFDDEEDFSPEVVAISGKAPYYVDAGAAMVPIRPIADFLGLDIKYHGGVVSISGALPSLRQDKSGDPEEMADHPIFVNLREGSLVAQIIEGVHNRTFDLDSAPETRLGVMFVPLRFIASAFDAEVNYNAESSLITVQIGNRIGYLRQPDQCGSAAAKTVNLTVLNRVGKPLSLQLEGPCQFRIELGRLQKVTVKLPPGLYTYTAASKGTHPRRGKHWLRKGGEINWTFRG